MNGFGTQTTEEISVELPMKMPDAPIKNGNTAYKNIEMEQMLAALEKHLDRTDKIGYAAARNTRILRSEMQEYLQRREELINKYGEQELDTEGNPTGRTMLAFDSPEFVEYSKEIEEWALIEHSPNLFKLKFEDAIDRISGHELLEIEWMFED